jgi:hypothetical protein
MAIAATWDAMVASVRNVGRPGIAATAISAVDAALWDLKARLLELPLVLLLGGGRPSVPVYGSGGFASYTLEQLAAAALGLDGGRNPSREDEGWPGRWRRPRARSGCARGDRCGARALRRRERRRHLEWFHDHVRIERPLFDGFVQPVDGTLAPRLDSPGLGLELKRSDAERYAI